MIVSLKASKTDPFRQGCSIRLASVDNELCPVLNMRTFATSIFVCGSTVPHVPELLFGTSGHGIVIKAMLPRDIRLNTHSFRIGGASAELE